MGCRLGEASGAEAVGPSRSAGREGRRVDEEIEALAEAALAEASRNQTAKRAAQILLRSNSGFVVPTAKQKRLLLVEFARQNFVVYGKAFDVGRLAGTVDPNYAHHLQQNPHKLSLC